MLKRAETTCDKPVITSVQSQAANMPASGWVLRLQLIVCNSEGYRFCHGKSSMLLCHYSDAPDGQPRMMLSYVCCFLSHSKNGKISVISGRRLQPITYWIRQLAAEDEPLKAPSCPQSEEAAAYLWDLSNVCWLPSFLSGMTHDDDS